jgi:hypothetical protein
MFLVGLVYCSMRLGVPFIAPRQLGAVVDRFGRCWGHASLPKVPQEETPSANPFERSTEATIHEASVL